MLSGYCKKITDSHHDLRFPMFREILAIDIEIWSKGLDAEAFA